MSKLIKVINLGDHIGLVDVVKGSDCEDCMFKDLDTGGLCCNDIVETFTGIQCELDDIYLTKHISYKWIQCTPDNIKVGDELRLINNLNKTLTIQEIEHVVTTTRINGGYPNREESLFIKGDKMDIDNCINNFEKRVTA